MSHGNEARAMKREPARSAYVPTRRTCEREACGRPFEAPRMQPRARYCCDQCQGLDYDHKRRDGTGKTSEQLREEAEARQMEALRRKAESEAAQANTYGPGLMGEALYTTTMQLMRRTA